MLGMSNNQLRSPIGAGFRQARIAVFTWWSFALHAALYVAAPVVLVGAVIIGVFAVRLFGSNIIALGTVFGYALAIIIALAASRSRSRAKLLAERDRRSARNAADAAEARMTSAHYPRAWLLRGQWPGSDRR
jgi:hypothetical protein